MKIAVGLTAFTFGALLIWSGFKDTSISDIFKGTLSSGTLPTQTSTPNPTA